MFKKTLLFCLSIYFCSFGFSQTQFGRISGKVIDRDSNNGIPSVTVYLYLGEIQKQSARTNSGGNFSFVNVLPDGYTIRASKAGFSEFSKFVRVNPNFTTKLFLSLSPLNSTPSALPVTSDAEAKATTSKPVATLPNPKKKSDAVGSAPSPSIAEPAIDSSKIIAETEPAQEEIKTDELVFIEAPQEMPEPVDGWNSLYKKIVYPEIARKQKASGTVTLSVYIDKNGDVISIEIIKSAHPALDKAAEDAVYELKFKPGRQEGRPVDTKIAVPVKFK